MQNWSVKDDIREYWTIRAETYDLSPGHGIAEVKEMDAWKHLITGHLGEGNDSKALDLACGTGVMTMPMHGLGLPRWNEPRGILVEPLDWASIRRGHLIHQLTAARS
jgi:hypothetical protein